jgi:hypothetical protein
MNEEKRMLFQLASAQEFPMTLSISILLTMKHMVLDRRRENARY